MTEFLHFFEIMPSWQKLAWILGCLGLSWSLEGLSPLVDFRYRKWKHAGTNLIFLATSIAINFIFGLITLGVFEWVGQQEFGILFLFELPIWLELVIAVMILDLVGQYWIHHLLHK